MYKMIRCSGDYGVAILVSPHDALPEMLEVKFYRIDTSRKIVKIDEISRNVAVGYFGGIADGLGWGELAVEPFETLEDARDYIVKQANEWARKKMAELRALKTKKPLV